MVKVLIDKFPKNYNEQGNRTPGMYMDGTLQKNLDAAKKALRNDFDVFIIIDGSEGSGKSVLAQQIATYIDPTFNADRICFRAEDFKKTIMKAERYTAVQFDEAYGGLSSRRAMSGTNHMLVDMFAEIRQRNLAVIIVIPSFFELDKYAAIHRSTMLINVYHNHFERGYFRVYSGKQKKLMYLLGRKTYNYKVIKSPAFIGRFTNFYCVDKEKYKAKKASTLRALESDNQKPEKKDPMVMKAYRVLYYMAKQMGRTACEKTCTDAGIPMTFLRRFKENYESDMAEQWEEENRKKMEGFKMPDIPE